MPNGAGRTRERRARERWAFLSAVGCTDAEIEPIPGDASFRRYFRVRMKMTANSEPRSRILMDAPPEREDVHPFVAIDSLLRRHGFSVPEILAADPGSGFLLLEDFGDASFTRLLQKKRQRTALPDEDTLYAAAVDLLAALGRDIELPIGDIVRIGWPPATLAREHAPDDYRLAAYDAEKLRDEARLWIDWYLPLVTGRSCDDKLLAEFHALWDPIFTEIEDATGRDAVLVLRDYHADNLMWLSERTGIARVGLLDFQDAVIGHPAYDLVSLLHDARRDVPRDLEERMLRRYLDACGRDPANFRRLYALLGAQRATKVIGIFSRLARRDGKSRYLKMIPRVWGLLEHSLTLAGEAALTDFFDHLVAPERRYDIPRLPKEKSAS
ncbi:MAG: DUF1679 domain-containing protein [Alphaproteobacteria bacterium]|nr:MAG: DUF1679 domain-containing protein [Alphaproteobacteria bacterium]